MVVLDTNIYIYLSNGTLDRCSIKNTDIAYSSVTKIEALGYSSIPANELLLLSALFYESYNLPLTDTIVDKAIKLRQAKRMNLGDSIIAATCLEHDLILWTVNTDDFHHIEGLELLNPISNGL